MAPIYCNSKEGQREFSEGRFHHNIVSYIVMDVYFDNRKG